MKRIIMVLISMMAINASAQQYEARGDVQYPRRGLTDLQFMQGAYVPLTAVLVEDGQIYTNITTLSCTFMYGYSPTSTAFVICTNVSKSPANGSFSIPIAATDTATNGLFWYTLKYTTADGKPFFTGTGTLEIVRTTAGGSPSSINWQTPVNWQGFVYTNGQTHGPVLPGSNVLTRPGPNGSYYIDAQVLQLVDVAQEAIDAASSTNRSLSDIRYVLEADKYIDADATNAVQTAYPGIVNAGNIAGNSSAISVLQTGKVGVAEFQASNGAHSAAIAILNTGKVSQAAWQASNAVLQANINAAQGLATMGGDVTGSSTNATVVKIQNIPVGDLAPDSGSDGYGLKYDHAQGLMVLGPVASEGNSISNLVVVSNTASSTDVPFEKVGMYRTIRPGDLPAMCLNVGGYEAVWIDLLGITLQSGSIHLLSDYLGVNPAAYDGSVGAPAYTWGEDRDLGKYRMSYAGDYAEAYCVSSNLVWYWASDGLHLTNGAKAFGISYNDLIDKPDMSSLSSNLASHVGSNNVQFAGLQAQVSSNDVDISSLQAQISSNNVSGLQAQITSNDVDIASALAQIGTNTSSISTVAGSNTTAHASFTAQLGTNNASISSLSAQLGSNTTAHASFTAQLGTNNASISSLSAQLGSNATAHASFTAQLGTNNASIDSLSAQLGTNNASISSAFSQISSNDTDISSLQAQVDTNNAGIVAGSSNLAAHAVANTTAFQKTTNDFTAAVSNWWDHPAKDDIIFEDSSANIAGGGLRLRNTNDSSFVWLQATALGSGPSGPGVLSLGTNYSSVGRGNTYIHAGGFGPGSPAQYTYGQIFFCVQGLQNPADASNRPATVAGVIGTNGTWDMYGHYVTNFYVGEPVATNSPANKSYVDGKFTPGKSITNSWVDAGSVTNLQIFLNGLLTSWKTNGVEL